MSRLLPRIARATLGHQWAMAPLRQVYGSRCRSSTTNACCSSTRAASTAFASCNAAHGRVKVAWSKRFTTTRPSRARGVRRVTRRVVSGCVVPDNNDSYEQLKVEYADVPGVHIYAKEDYDVEGINVPWLDDDNGIDCQQLAHRTANRPVPPGFTVAPQRWTDVWSQEDLDSFATRAETYDPTTGVYWNDAPTDLHLLHEREFSDLRFDDTTDDQCEHPDPPPDLPFPPLPRKQISHHQLLFELDKCFDELQAINAEEDEQIPVAPLASSGNVPQPSVEDVRKWEAAEKARGGVSSENDRHALPPYAPYVEPPTPDFADVPPQFSALIDTHVGQWQGVAQIFALNWLKDDVRVTSTGEARVESDFDGAENGGALVWETCTDMDDLSHTSSVRFAEKRDGAEPELLFPGRCVFECGAYVVLHTPGDTSPTPSFSLSNQCIDSLVGALVTPAIEMCVVQGESFAARRTRVLLCTQPRAQRSRRGGRGVAPKEQWSHVISIDETRIEAGAYAPCISAIKHTESILNGRWTGNGISLHPEYPLIPAINIQSVQHWHTHPAPIAPQHVTWAVVDDLSRITDESKRYSVATQGSRNQRRSRRVRAALEHDRQRLASCQLLCSDSLGDEPHNVHAWRIAHSQMYSPRLGQFVPDYFAISLPNALLLTAPAAAAWPCTKTFLSLTSLTTPSRSRLVVARSALAQLVGAAMLKEALDEAA